MRAAAIVVSVGLASCLAVGTRAECIGGPSASFAEVVTGYFNTCGLTTQGAAYCWGTDDGGRLGDGGASSDSQIPVGVDTTPITGEEAFIQLTAGDAHVCGLTAEGAAYCWGYDTNGQLGDGGVSGNAYSPVRVDTTLMTGPKAFVKLAAGGAHTCGLTADGAAYCWGSDAYGQLGDGGSSVESQIPVAVDRSPLNGRALVQITAGADHTCAVTADGGAYCWGRNLHGQLGDGNAPLDSQSPSPVDSASAFVHLTAGFIHTCGLTAEGAALCWGSDTDGQLGDGGVPGDSPVPVAVDATQFGSRPLVGLTAGTSHACGLTADGAAYCWGFDGEGQLGDGGSTASFHYPVAVDRGPLGGKSLIRLSAGGSHTCGLTADGGLYCWGSDSYGQLGDGGNAQDSLVPVPVDASGVTGRMVLVQLAAGYWHNCGIASGGEPYCWGADDHGQLGDGGSLQNATTPVLVDATGITGDRAFVQTTGGGFHTCGLTSEGRAYCWGLDGYGQLGDGGTSMDSQTPVAVDTSGITGEKTFVSLSAGNIHTCGLTPAGVAYCWGRDASGQIGDGGTSQDAQSPVAVDTSGIAGTGVFVAISAGDDHTCGLTPEGAAYCWGADLYGQLGDGGAAQGSQIPVAVDTSGIAGEKALVTLIAGGYHSCGLTPEGWAYCWGLDRSGQLGDGGSATNSQVPVPVDTSGITGEKLFVRLAGGSSHTCGLTAEGVPYCWGLDGYGQLGDGGASQDSQIPVAVDRTNVTGGKAFVALSVGSRHTCGLTAEGGTYCWGGDAMGQLGDDDLHINAGSPVAVEQCPSTCAADTDCPRCQECIPPDCVNQAAGSDVKEECSEGECLTGECDGNGACGHVPDGNTCGDGNDTDCDNPDACLAGSCRDNFEPAGKSCADDLFCNGQETCDGTGSCRAGSDPCFPRDCDEETDQCTGACTPVAPDDVTCDGVDDDCDGSTDEDANTAGTCDDGRYCTGAETCDANGSCRSSGDPCPGGPCNTCQEDTDSCFDPPGAPCDDGRYCTGVDTCDGSGTCVSTGDPCPDTECNQCNEDDDTCLDPRDTLCSECHLCDGAGNCDLGRTAPDWTTACTDLQTRCPGLCLSGDCAVEEVCNHADYCREMTYPENEGHCRIPTGRIFMGVEVEPTSAGAGEFVPARVVLQNRWHEALVRMSVVLKLNPPDPDGSERKARVAYVCDSAIANGGELELVETRVEAEELVRIDLADLEKGLPDPVVLDLLLRVGAGPPEDARFELSVWAPCQSTPEEVGCHPGHPGYPDDPPWSSQDWRLQQLTDAVRKDLRGATYDENDRRSGMLRSPVLGCQCGAVEGTGWTWPFWILVFKRARRRAR